MASHAPLNAHGIVEHLQIEKERHQVRNRQDLLEGQLAAEVDYDDGAQEEAKSTNGWKVAIRRSAFSMESR